MRRFLAVLLVPAMAVTAGLLAVVPASAAFPDCAGDTGPNTRVSNSGAHAEIHDCTFHGLHSGMVSGGTIENLTGATLTLRNVTISDSQVSGGRDGGAIWNTGILTLINVTVTSSTARLGGAIWNAGTLHLNGVTIGGPGSAGNSADEDGGGIWDERGFDTAGPNPSPVVSFINNRALGTSTRGDGGGLWYDGFNKSLAHLVFQGNRAKRNGGGLWNITAIGFNLSSFTGNHADGNGGGVYSGCETTLTNSTISGNTAGGSGGGLFQEPNCDSLVLANDTISGNRATVNGGGIALHGGDLRGPVVLTKGAAPKSAAPRSIILASAPNLTISGNIAGANGGGISLDCHPGIPLINSVSSRAALLNPTIADNSATLGGGIWGEGAGEACNEGSFIRLQNALVARNAPTNCVATVTELGGPNASNLETGHSCKFSQPSDQNDVSNPGLGPLADNFGPAQTQGLLPGSPALDMVKGTCPPPLADERGVSRPRASACDIGAYECIGSAPTVTSVAPATGPQSGGTEVTITGANFDRPAKVSFGTSAATSVVVNSSTSITAMSPPGTGTTIVIVQTCRASGTMGFAYVVPALPKAGQPLAAAGLAPAGLLILALVTGVPGVVILRIRRREARARG